MMVEEDNGGGIKFLGLTKWMNENNIHGVIG